MKYKDALTEYKTYLIIERGVSQNTLDSYLRDTRTFLSYLKNNNGICNIEDISREHIRLFLRSLQQLSPATVSRKIVSLRNFFKFMIKENVISTDIMAVFELPKAEKKLPQVLSVKEMEQMLNSIEMKDFISARNRAMVELLYASGIRVSELVNLQLAQINLKMMYLKVIGKGNKERLIPLSHYVCQIVNTYIVDFRNPFLDFKTNPYLFFNKHYQPLSRENFYRILKQIAKKAGITKKISPHTIRHTYATHLLENNADLRSIQELLGHSDISTTTIYTHITNKKIWDDYNKYHIRAQNKKTHNGG